MKTFINYLLAILLVVIMANLLVVKTDAQAITLMFVSFFVTFIFIKINKKIVQ
tara:strand:+ start:309 stop:467 length:159 start_codon:yes stop_codon:yes gene_type:complete